MAPDWRDRLIGKWSWLRLLRSTILIIGIIYALLVAAALFLSNRMIFPYRGSSYDGTLPGLKLLTAHDGTEVATRLWSRRDAEEIVLLFHGNYEDIGELDLIAEAVSGLGVAVLAIDYRGYGLSGGRPTESSCYADGRLLVDHARELGFRPRDIVLWGRSVGAGVAVQMAVEIDARALVLESPFVTAFRALTHVPLLPFDKFNNLAKIGDLAEPLFIIHGDSDTIIPAWHSASLLERHPGPKERHLVEGAGHNDLWLHRLEPVIQRLEEFLGASR